MKRRSSNPSPKSKRRITSLLRENPFDERIDYTDVMTILSLAELDRENALVQLECAKSLATFNYAKAKTCFEKAIALEPKNATFYFQYAEATRNNGKSSQRLYNKAYELEPMNADHILGFRNQFQRTWHPINPRRVQLLQKALSVDPTHCRANYVFAKENVGWRSYDSILAHNDKVQKVFPYAKRALKNTSFLTRREEAHMHDIVACVYAKERRFRSALHHYDKALVCEPLQGIRNYWKFLRKNKLEPELLKIVEGSLAKNFELRQGRGVADLFKMYSLLSPGFRALLKKNSRSTYLFLHEFAHRERQWMLTVYPFNSEFFPKTVIMEILDFLFFL